MIKIMLGVMQLEWFMLKSTKLRIDSFGLLSLLAIVEMH